ncbi:hypothetical protein GCM10011348_28770 [Marinobacterium nitratireducens]|uniref:TRAP transporter small permease protein n=1 Tax=Marinobacterium nitratireducens TaxID=518897 RepID=A0A917ZJV8_9GAMM|nr:TRAP transporter small permease [Marinobacterium nitratireducens]GGO83862.1 hypothetical protein GCM10011348_28770 [Marinobacterium nitratireducens]
MKALANSLNWLEHRILHLEGLFIALAMTALIVDLFLQVLFRFLLDQPLDFTEELARILFAWLVFVGAAHALYHAQHFVVDLVYDALPPRAQSIAGYLVDGVVALFVLTLAWVGFRAVLSGSGAILPVLQIPASVQTLAMPAGMALMVFHTLVMLFNRRHVGDALAT